MKDTDYNESREQERLHKKYHSPKHQQDIAIRQQMRTTVLATIDELNQYLLGNVTLEAATAAAGELQFSLLEVIEYNYYKR